MDVEKTGGRLFRRPKLTLSCSAEGKEGRKESAEKATDDSEEHAGFLLCLLFNHEDGGKMLL
jgi:hypothetical protein